MAGSLILDSRGTPLAQPSQAPAFVRDNLRAAIGAVGFAGGGGHSGFIGRYFTPQLALAAYRASGMLRKVISIPADDRVREWRDWQADADTIGKVEKEERRLALIAKVKEAEILRGICGGALLLVTEGDHASPLTAESIREGGLVAVNVLSRWQLTGQEWDRDHASPGYGSPKLWQLNNQTQAKVHPSRVICFRGDALPDDGTLTDEDRFWGDTRLMRVYRAVETSDDATRWFSELVKKAKLLRIGIPDLDSMDPDRVARRVQLIAEGEGVLNATVYRSSGRADDVGEKIDDYQVTWAGIPAMMDAFDQRVAAVADIPFTRLMGRSPAGMNSTGEHDMANWNKAVAAGQRLELRPCLEAIDPLLLRSAGVAAPDEVTWRFAPLDVPSEKVEAETFKTTMEAVEKLRADASIPEVALNKAVQNLMSEREWLPGIDAALAEIPEAERFGELPHDDGSEPDPSAITQPGNGGREVIRQSAEGGADPVEAAPRRRAANDAATWLADATPRPLYVQRKLLNAADLIAWAKANGFDTTLPAGDMHVTVLYSRSPVDPMQMGRDWREDDRGQITVRPGGPRMIERLGGDAVVLRFVSPDLEYRHRDMVEAGGSHDWPEYQPHVTLSYGVPAGVDVEAIKPFNGELRFGPEIFEALDLDWKRKVSEE